MLGIWYLEVFAAAATQQVVWLSVYRAGSSVAMWRFFDFVGAVALGVLAYSGQLKLLPTMGWNPVDLTLLAGAITIGCSIIFFLSKRPSLGILVPTGLWICFLFPAFSVADTSYGTQKLLTLFTFTLIVALAPFFVLRTEQQRRFFLGTLIALACFVAVTSYQGGALESLTGSTFEDISPIGLSRVMGTGVVVLLIFVFSGGIRAVWRVTMLVMASGLLVVIFASGRRGPVLAIVVGVLLALAFAPAFHKHRIRTFFVGLIALIGAGWYALSRGSAGSERVFSFLTGEQDASTSAREYIWAEALDLVASHPAGVGWAAFPQYADVGTMTSASGRMYPHNLFLEGFVEAGWLVGTLLLVFSVAAVLRLRKLAITPTLAACLGLLGFTLTNAMVSGDVNDQKLMWIILSLAFVLTRRPSEISAPVTPRFEQSI